MEEMVTLTRWDLIYSGMIAGCFAIMLYLLAELFDCRVLPLLKEKRKCRKEKRDKNK